MLTANPAPESGENHVPNRQNGLDSVTLVWHFLFRLTELRPSRRTQASGDAGEAASGEARMLDEIVTGFIGGIVGERLFGRWARRHPYLTLAICVPPLLFVAFMAGRQLLGLYAA